MLLKKQQQHINMTDLMDRDCSQNSKHSIVYTETII